LHSNSPSLFKGQLIHLIALIILFSLTWKIWKIFGSQFPYLFWTCILIPTIHQIYVWLTWRLELKSKLISKTIGFNWYLNIFFLFLLLRPISLFALAFLDANSLGLSITFRIIFTVVTFIPAVYTILSVKRYFGFKRAAGADHFKSEYRSMPLVKDGIFKYTSNGMYLFGFFILWSIALGFNSCSSLLVAAFSHVSIWIHFYATEKPNMNYIYSGFVTV